MKRKIRNLAAYFFPLLFIAYLGSITIFTHIHNVDGLMVVHSHPFKTLHHNSASEYETIFLLSYLISDGSQNIPFKALFCVLFVVLILLKREKREFSTVRYVISLRAPPVYF